MRWPDVQCQFAERLRDPEAPVPATIAPIQAGSSLGRFNVYRNNSSHSLIEALGAAYPVVRSLVGDVFFSAMARVFVAQNVPTSPVILTYGKELPEFIAGFEPAANLPYLADVARFEQAWLGAYHAEDCEPVGIDQLAGIADDQLEDVQLVLHPSCHVVCSDWPVASIWQAHQGSDDPAHAMQQLTPDGEPALIVRPQYDVDVRLISRQAARFFEALGQGKTMGQAAEALTESQATDIGGMLQLLFAVGGVAGVSCGHAGPPGPRQSLEA